MRCWSESNSLQGASSRWHSWWSLKRNCEGKSLSTLLRFQVCCKQKVYGKCGVVYVLLFTEMVGVVLLHSIYTMSPTRRAVTQYAETIFQRYARSERFFNLLREMLDIWHYSPAQRSHPPPKNRISPLWQYTLIEDSLHGRQAWSGFCSWLSGRLNIFSSQDVIANFSFKVCRKNLILFQHISPSCNPEYFCCCCCCCCCCCTESHSDLFWLLSFKSFTAKTRCCWVFYFGSCTVVKDANPRVCHYPPLATNAPITSSDNVYFQFLEARRKHTSDPSSKN